MDILILIKKIITQCAAAAVCRGRSGRAGRTQVGAESSFQRKGCRAEPAAGSRGWAQLLVPAPRAPLLRGLPRGRGRARLGLGAAWGAGLGPCAPRWSPPGRKVPRPSRKPGSAPCSGRVSASLTLHHGPSRFATEARGASGETSFERETCDAWLAAVRRTPACGQAREGVLLLRPCLWWSLVPAKGRVRSPSLHFRPVHSGLARAFPPRRPLCPGRLACLPLRPSPEAGSPRAPGRTGGL